MTTRLIIAALYTIVAAALWITVVRAINNDPPDAIPYPITLAHVDNDTGETNQITIYFVNNGEIVWGSGKHGAQMEGGK